MAVADRQEIHIEGVEVISREEGLRLLDEKAQRYLGVSGEEFLQCWDAGYYAKDADRPELMRVAMLIPFAR